MTCTTRYATAVLLVTTIVVAGRPPAAADQTPSSEASYAVVVKKSTAEDAQWQKVVAALKDETQRVGYHVRRVGRRIARRAEAGVSSLHLFRRQAGRRRADVRRPGSPTDPQAG